MRLVIALFIVSTSPAFAAQEIRGSFTCAYAGSWACAPPDQPQGICIDSGLPQPKRFTLLLNFDSKPLPRIRLNGLDGLLQPNPDPPAYTVAWSLGAVGRPKFSVKWSEDGALTVTIIHTEQDGAYVSANFKCRRSPRPVL